jgi:hypothetical protein
MNFKIEQIALCPVDPQAAIELLTEMGLGQWARDHVVAEGVVYGKPDVNEADLAFNYEGSSDKPLELEVLHYTQGANWMQHRDRVNSVSHLGMHCDHEELDHWFDFFAARGIALAQGVDTLSHTNPAIAGQRWYRYAIFDTKAILGVDIKFIVRKSSARILVED